MSELERLQKLLEAQDEAHKAELVRLNWAEIKALVEEDAYEKRKKLIFSPGVSQGPGQWLTFQCFFL